MAKIFSVVLLLLLAGCSGMARLESTPSPCSAGEASYACQVERYHNVNAD